MRLISSFLAALCLFSAAVARADDAFVMTHQGRLLDGDDKPVNGSHRLGFAFFALPTHVDGAQPLWKQTWDVDVRQGLYAVTLGSLDGGHLPLSLEVFKDVSSLYLEVEIDGVALNPRLRVGSVASAGTARRAFDLACTGCVTRTHLAPGLLDGLDARSVGGIVPNAAPTPGGLLVLDANGRVPASALPANIAAGNATSVGGFAPSATAAPNAIPVLDDAGRLAAAMLPPVDAASVGGAKTSALSAPGAIPLLGANGRLDASMLPNPLDAATLNGAGSSATAAAGKIPVLGANGKLDAAMVPAGDALTLNGAGSSATSAAGKIPVLGANGKLDSAMIPALDAATLNGATTSATAAAGKIPLLDGSGKLDPAMLPAGGAAILNGTAAQNASFNVTGSGATGDFTFKGTLRADTQALAMSVNRTISVSTTGSDTTGDGTGSKPYATIARALQDVPTILDKSATIQLAAGTYSGTVNIRGFVGRGNLTIAGVSTDPLGSLSVVLNGTINVNSVHVPLYLNSIRIASGNTMALYAQTSDEVHVDHSYLQNTGGAGQWAKTAIFFSIANGYVTNSTVTSNGQYGAVVLASGASYLYVGSSSVSGGGSVTEEGIEAVFGATAYVAGTNVSAVSSAVVVGVDHYGHGLGGDLVLNSATISATSYCMSANGGGHIRNYGGNTFSCPAMQTVSSGGGVY